MSLLCNSRFPKKEKQDIVVIKKINIDNYKSTMLQSEYLPNVAKKLSSKHLYLFIYSSLEYSINFGIINFKKFLYSFSFIKPLKELIAKQAKTILSFV